MPVILSFQYQGPVVYLCQKAPRAKFKCEPFFIMKM